MANLDDRARRAAAQLRADADRRVDPEAGLARIRREAGGGARQRRWSPRLLPAAAAVAVIVAGVAVLATRSGPAPVADVPETTSAPLPTVTPSTLPDTTAPAPTTVPGTTTTAPGTTLAPPSTAPPRGELPLPVLDIPPLLFPLALPGCALPQCTIASAGDGVLVALDATTETFVVDLEAGPDAVTVTPSEPLGEYAYLVAVGPGMVAYVAAMSDLANAPAMDLVVVALSGDRAGRVIDRLVGVVDGSGDTDLVPTRDGLVGVGCCGPDTVRPDPDQEPLIGWLGPEGEPLVDPGPHVTVELVDGQAYSVLALSGGEDRQRLPVGNWFRGMPLTAVVGEGEYYVSWWDVDGGFGLVRVSEAAGLAYEIAVPDDLSVVTLDVRGAVVFDGQEFHRWPVPSLAAAQDATATVSSWLPPSAEKVSELVDAALAHLRAGDGCENPSSAEAEVGALSDDAAVMRIIHREHCDDSVGGSLIELELVRDPQTLTWQLERATSWALCLRGGLDLCV